jgi:aldehyde:ferredoxin oxidoreductase
MKITEGPYRGFEGEEPEYECMAAFGSQIGNTDAGAALMLDTTTSRLGLDANESGWIIGWVMECYEKGILTKEDTDGLEMNWGNVEATVRVLHKIAGREGFGSILAEGVKRASEGMGGEAAKMGVYTMKGASPRGHDDRGRWTEMFDTCLSNTSTIESTTGRFYLPGEAIGANPNPNFFSPEDVVEWVAKYNGWQMFLDSLGICRFTVRDQWRQLIDTFNAITGWNWKLWDAMHMGRRVVNTLRIFNLRHGLNPALEVPSARYGSAPIDGPCKDIGIGEHWNRMVRKYRSLMGWEPETGKPLPETLRKLDLE